MLYKVKFFPSRFSNQAPRYIMLYSVYKSEIKLSKTYSCHILMKVTSHSAALCLLLLWGNLLTLLNCFRSFEVIGSFSTCHQFHIGCRCFLVRCSCCIDCMYSKKSLPQRLCLWYFFYSSIQMSAMWLFISLHAFAVSFEIVFQICTL